MVSEDVIPISGWLTLGVEHCRLWVSDLALHPYTELTDSFAFQFPTILTQMGYRAQYAQLLTVPV